MMRAADHGQKDWPACPLCRIIAVMELPTVMTLPRLQLRP